MSMIMMMMMMMIVMMIMMMMMVMMMMDSDSTLVYILHWLVFDNIRNFSRPLFYTYRYRQFIKLDNSYDDDDDDDDYNYDVNYVDDKKKNI